MTDWIRRPASRHFGEYGSQTGHEPSKSGLRRRAIVLHPEVKSGTQAQAGQVRRDPQAALEEACGLALAIDLKIVAAQVVSIAKLRPATLIGQGKIEELAALAKANDAEVLIMDAALTPVQQRNLEREINIKVIDRTGLILEIFGERARTKEGVLQVELAHLTYQQSRLVRSWTHLERQRGGFGFLGGPGETQIETDRRLLRNRIARLKKELSEVSRTRALHRKERKKVPYPIIALVGYTNAGKSTLFNRLTAAKVTAQDMLFATLDPTLRMVMTPAGRKVILSDTVGFISNLPTQLVAAFRATLEEVIEADILLHVRDSAHVDSQAQRQDVLDVLEDLGVADSEGGAPIIEVMNKIDLLSTEENAALATRAKQDTHMVAASAITGEGCEEILSLIDAHLDAAQLLYEVHFPNSDGATFAWLHDHGHVTSVEQSEKGETIALVRMSESDAGRIANRNGLSLTLLHSA